MENIRIGCAGWSYQDWRNVFYPHKMHENQFLRHYSKVFDFVEVNSPFYNTPSVKTVKTWQKSTPDNFRFSIKFLKDITHKRATHDLENQITEFLKPFGILSEKIFCFLLQYPPNFRYSSKNMDYFNSIIKILPREYSYVLEFRDDSWFQAKVMEEIHGQIVERKNIIIGTVYLDGVKPFYHDGQGMVYIRLIKDRILKKFDRQQRKELGIFQDLVLKVKDLMNSPDISDIFIIFNNHFRGFSPHDVYELKKVLNLPNKEFHSQKTLLDYL